MSGVRKSHARSEARIKVWTGKEGGTNEDRWSRGRGEQRAGRSEERGGRPSRSSSTQRTKESRTREDTPSFPKLVQALCQGQRKRGVLRASDRRGMECSRNSCGLEGSWAATRKAARRRLSPRLRGRRVLRCRKSDIEPAGNPYSTSAAYSAAVHTRTRMSCHSVLSQQQ